MWEYGDEEEGFDTGGGEPVLHLTMADLRRLGAGSLGFLVAMVGLSLALCRGLGKSDKTHGGRAAATVSGAGDLYVDDMESESRCGTFPTMARGQGHLGSGAAGASRRMASPPASSSLRSSAVTLSCVPFDCPMGRRVPAVAVTEDGDVYVHGGESERGGLLSGFSVYQQRNVAWEHAIDLPSTSAAEQPPGAASENMTPGSRAQHTLVACGEYLVLYGGECDPQERCGGVTDPALYLFHTLSHEWVRFDISQRDDAVVAQPPGRLGHSMCVRAGHELVVFGGRGGDDGSITLDDVWTFDLLQFSEDKGRRSPAASASDAAATEGEDEESIAGWVQQPLDTSAHAPATRCGHCASVVGGVAADSAPAVASGERMVVIGGVDAAGTTALVAPGEVEVLDLLTWKWSVAATTGRGPLAAAGMGSHTLPTPKWDAILVVGCDPAVPGIFNELFVLDMGQRSPTWTSLAINWHGDWTMIPGRRTNFGAAIDEANAMIFVFGGDNDSGMLHDSLLVVDVAELLGLDTSNGNDASSAGEGAASLSAGASNGWSSNDANEPMTVRSLCEQITSGRHLKSPSVLPEAAAAAAAATAGFGSGASM